MKSFALFFGLNYINTPIMRLRGCWNDAIALSSLFTSELYNIPIECTESILDNFIDIRLIRHKTSKNSMIVKLYELALKSWSDELERVIISFSGHGSYVTDNNGDETDGKDEGICPSDCTVSGLIIDDELLKILNMFNPMTRVYVIMDSCHSGSMLDLPYNSTGASDTNVGADIKPHIIMISGCTDPQTSADAYIQKTSKFGGALTTSIIDVLTEDEDMSLGLLEFHEKLTKKIIEGKYPQRPVLSSSRPITNEYKMFM